MGRRRQACTSTAAAVAETARRRWPQVMHSECIYWGPDLMSDDDDHLRAAVAAENH